MAETSFRSRPTVHAAACAVGALAVLRAVALRALVPAALGALWSSATLAQPAPSAPVASAPSIIAGAGGELRFDILAYVVEGDSVLGSAAIERVVYPFLGPGRTIGDAEAARRALERAYQEAGFLSVSVLLPQQAIDAGGELRLVVQQAPVDRLRVTGARHVLPELIRQAVPSLAPGAVPDFNVMQAELGRLVERNADLEITPVISAGSQPGTLAVELKVQDQLPLHGQAELNSKQSPGTERGRLEAGVRYDNLFQVGHSLGLDWIVAPTRPSDANVLTLTYAAPLGGPGDRLSLVYTHSSSDTPTPLGGVTLTRGDTWVLRWRDSLPRRSGTDQALSWSLTQRDLRDRNRGVAGFDIDPPSLRYTLLGVSHEFSMDGQAPGRSSNLEFGVQVSLPGLNRRSVDCFGRELDQFRCKRADADARFQVWSLRALHTEPLGPWTLGIGLLGQFADTPLVPSDQLSLGGVNNVRGYLEGEQASDAALSVRLTLFAPEWSPAEGWSLKLHGFYDAAAMRRLYALPSEPQVVQLGSAGLGLQLSRGAGLRARLDWAHVLLGTARADATGTPAGTRRWELSVRQAF